MTLDTFKKTKRCSLPVMSGLDVMGSVSWVRLIQLVRRDGLGPQTETPPSNHRLISSRRTAVAAQLPTSSIDVISLALTELHIHAARFKNLAKVGNG